MVAIFLTMSKFEMNYDIKGVTTKDEQGFGSHHILTWMDQYNWKEGGLEVIMVEFQSPLCELRTYKYCLVKKFMSAHLPFALVGHHL